MRSFRDELTLLILGEALTQTNIHEVLRILGEVGKEVLADYPRLCEAHAECVRWYERNVVEAAETKALTSLLPMLHQLSQMNIGLDTFGAICRLTEEGFCNIGCVGGKEGLCGFRTLVEATIPDRSVAMLRVFCHHGLDPLEKTTIIRRWVKV